MSFEKPKSSYESILISSVKNGGEAASAVIAKFKDIIETSGRLDSFDDWGVRKLAYPINKENEGHYVMFSFTSDGDFPAELDRIYKITDGVLRSMIIKKAEPIKAPAAAG